MIYLVDAEVLRNFDIFIYQNMYFNNLMTNYQIICTKTKFSTRRSML